MKDYIVKFVLNYICYASGFIVCCMVNKKNISKTKRIICTVLGLLTGPLIIPFILLLKSKR